MLMHLYDTIGFEPDETRRIVEQISAANGDIEVRINSEGGSVFDGMAIYNTLSQYEGGQVNVYVDGVAASIASVIAMAGDNIYMAQGSWLMIHQPASFMMYGNAQTLRKEADVLDKLEGGIIGIYASKTGMDTEEIAQMLQDETWLSGDEAVSLGFATKTLSSEKLVRKLNLSPYSKTPSSVLDEFGMATQTLKVARTVEHSLRDAGMSVSAAKRIATRAANSLPDKHLREVESGKRNWKEIVDKLKVLSNLYEV